VIDHEPTMEERFVIHARIAKIVDEGGYRASRRRWILPVSKHWCRWCKMPRAAMR